MGDRIASDIVASRKDEQQLHMCDSVKRHRRCIDKDQWATESLAT